MSGSSASQPLANPVGTPSDFALYLIQERAKSVPIVTYDLNNSIRIWLRQFEQQARIHGVNSKDDCTTHLTRYLPTVIQQWIPTLALGIVSSWDLLKEALITRFGIPEEEDNRLLLTQLKACKQQPQKSFRLHAAKWEHLLSMITTACTEKTKITYFIQSLNSRDTKFTLTSLVFSMKLDQLSQVINHAIELEDTGAVINGIQLELFSSMQVQLDARERIAYRDVNNNIKTTCGTATISVFNQDIKVHGIDGLSSPLIVGWNTISKFKGNIDSDAGIVSLIMDKKTIKIPLDTSKEPNINNLETASSKTTQHVLDKFDSIIAKNPDKPSVTHVIEYYIDTGDHPSIHCKRRIFHPDLQAQIDEKLDSMVDNSLLEKVAFSQWDSQVRPVEKPDGSMRVFDNYIQINRVTKPSNYPFPNMHNILQSLGQAKDFSKADLEHGYFQTPLLRKTRTRRR